MTISKEESLEVFQDPRAQELLHTLAANGLGDAARELMGKKPSMPYGIASLETEAWLEKFISVSPEITKLKHQVRVLSNYSDTVLITGETGTGKLLIAHALHGQRKGPFIDINCAGLPEYLIESELFGHIRGAFTDAYKDKVGLFQAAENGTMFLDEIGELTPGLQAKLLKAIEERQIRRVGDTKNLAINCRFVCATHHNLEEDVKSGKFREDLLARIDTFKMYIPSLSERGWGDIEAISLALLHIPQDKKLPEELYMKLNVEHKRNVRDLQRICRNYEVFVMKKPEL